MSYSDWIEFWTVSAVGWAIGALLYWGLTRLRRVMNERRKP